MNRMGEERRHCRKRSSVFGFEGNETVTGPSRKREAVALQLRGFFSCLVCAVYVCVPINIVIVYVCARTCVSV